MINLQFQELIKDPQTFTAAHDVWCLDAPPVDKTAEKTIYPQDATFVSEVLINRFKKNCLQILLSVNQPLSNIGELMDIATKLDPQESDDLEKSPIHERFSVPQGKQHAYAITADWVSDEQGRMPSIRMNKLQAQDLVNHKGKRLKTKGVINRSPDEINKWHFCPSYDEEQKIYGVTRGRRLVEMSPSANAPICYVVADNCRYINDMTCLLLDNGSQYLVLATEFGIVHGPNELPSIMDPTTSMNITGVSNDGKNSLWFTNANNTIYRCSFNGKKFEKPQIWAQQTKSKNSNGELQIMAGKNGSNPELSEWQTIGKNYIAVKRQAIPTQLKN